MERLHLAASAAAHDFGDEIVVLDLRATRYLLLHGSSARMWRALLGGDAAALIADLGAGDARRGALVAEDLEAFRLDCLERGLLVETPATGAAVHRRLRPAAAFNCLTLRAWAAILRVRARLARGLDDAWLAGRALQASVSPRPAGADLAPRLDAAVRAFVRAENLSSLKQAPEDCLPRSLALFAHLRALGFSVTHHIGVKRSPLEMHAWVEGPAGPLLGDTSTGAYARLATIG